MRSTEGSETTERPEPTTGSTTESPAVTGRRGRARLLRIWHLLFGVVALVLAADYLYRGYTQDARAELIKGTIWLALAAFMALPDVVAMVRSRRASGRAGVTRS